MSGIEEKAADDIQMAIVGVKEMLVREAQAQIAEKPSVWRSMALGVWADAEEDRLSHYKGDTPANRARVQALRYLESAGKRPYPATADMWCWFDSATVIPDMADEQSDLPTELWSLLGGKMDRGFKSFGSGLEAFEDFVAKVADHVAKTGSWPKAQAPK